MGPRTQVEGSAVDCMSGTSAILTEEKERRKSVDEGSIYMHIFTSVMPPPSQFPDRCQQTLSTFGRNFFPVPAKEMGPTLRSQDISVHFCDRKRPP